jgi:PPK2 family polyphosphate:nucleotide phosphotransferase
MNYMPVLSEISTRSPKELDKQDTKEKTEKLLLRLAELQPLLFAEGKHAVLVILQGMDASGKDGAVNKVFSSINPMGVSVKPFKQPTEEELKHDFLWRIHQNAPERGMIKIFNRSHYEDVLVTRVHGLIDDETARKRFDAINHFEELLAKHNSTRIFKFYLHISKEEQQERFKEREQIKSKEWKFNKQDLIEASYWDKYMEMYEDVFKYCNEYPWMIVPADQNWYKEYLIAKTIVEDLENLNMKYPSLKEKP